MFSNVFQIHDYYEMAVTVLFFLAGDGNPAGGGAPAAAGRQADGGDLVKWRNALIVVVGSALILLGPKLDVFQVTSDSDALTFLLSEQQRVLYVAEPASNPVLGGLTATPTDTMTHAQFEQDCTAEIAKYWAVLVDGRSPCLTAHRAEATSFVQSDRFTLGLDELHALGAHAGRLTLQVGRGGPPSTEGVP